MRPKAAVEPIPGVVGQVREIGIVSVAEPCRVPGSRRTFPLRLCRQTIVAGRRNVPSRQLLFRELGAIIGRIQPTHVFHRTVQIPREATWVGGVKEAIFRTIVLWPFRLLIESGVRLPSTPPISQSARAGASPRHRPGKATRAAFTSEPGPAVVDESSPVFLRRLFHRATRLSKAGDGVFPVPTTSRTPRAKAAASKPTDAKERRVR